MQDTKANNNTVSSTYTEPLGKNKILELNYAYTHNRNISDKESYDYNSISGKYDVLNLLQTNYFENTNTSSRLGFNYRLQKRNIITSLDWLFSLQNWKQKHKSKYWQRHHHHSKLYQLFPRRKFYIQR
jgi:hypothetical protein